MKLSLFSDYSLRVLMFAALKGGSFRKEEAAAAYGISNHHLGKVIHRLATLGYLKTRRGRGGGIELARPAREIRLGRLIEQTEHPFLLVECFDAETNTCPINGHCRLKGVLGGALREFYKALDQHHLEELVAGSSRANLDRILLGGAPPAGRVRRAGEG